MDTVKTFMPGYLPTLRDPPTEAEKDYVRRLLEPLEQALPPNDPRFRHRRTYPRREHVVLSEQQLLEIYRKGVQQGDDGAAIRFQMLRHPERGRS